MDPYYVMLSRLLSLEIPVAIAHRGGGRLRPENTLQAFQHAVSLGVDALECDVHLSRDGEVVVIHDSTLDRTTDASGPVSQFSAAELSRVDAGFQFDGHAGFPYRGARAYVPRLSEVLAVSPTTPVVIEIKGDRPEIVPRVLGVVAEQRAEARVLIGGFSRTVLDAVRRAPLAPPTGASSPEVLSALRRSYLWLRPRRPAFEVFQVPLNLRGRRVLTRSFVRAARRAGLPVQAWIIDDPADMRMLFDWGVTGITSDRPDLAVAEVARQGRVVR